MQSTTARVCAYSFVDERDLPGAPHQKLLTCSKCKCTHYVDRQSQVLDWKVHKQSCCSLADDDFDQWRESDYSTCDTLFSLDPDVHVPETDFKKSVSVAYKLLQYPSEIKGRKLLFAFQKILAYLLKKHADGDDFCEIELAIIEKRLFTPLTVATVYGKEEVFAKIWSIPGFANYFLSDDILLSPAMKQWKEQGRDLPPKETFKNGFNVSSTKYDDALQLPYSYITFLNKLFQTTCKQLVPTEILQQKNSIFLSCNFKPTAVAAAVVARLFKSWLCPYARVSYPSVVLLPSDTSGDAYCRSVVYTELIRSLQKPHEEWALPVQKWMRPHELLPGLSPKQILRVMMEDEAFFHTLPPVYALDMLLTVFNSRLLSPLPWTTLTATDRVELLKIAHDWEGPTFEMPKSFPLLITFPITFKDAFVQLIIIGFSSDVLFKVHNAAHKSSPPLDKSNLKLLQKTRQAALKNALPLVTEYVKIVGAKYRSRMAATKEESYFFPLELTEMIAEFAAPLDFGEV